MSETRERELVDARERAKRLRENAANLESDIEPGEPNSDICLREVAWLRETADLLEALSASTQVDGLREALEEARPIVANSERIERMRRSVNETRETRLTDLLAKIDAALASLPPGGEE